MGGRTKGVVVEFGQFRRRPIFWMLNFYEEREKENSLGGAINVARVCVKASPAKGRRCST